MSVTATTPLRWFAGHELRLIWRDFASMVTGGKPHRIAAVAAISLLAIAGLHLLAISALGPIVAASDLASKGALLIISGGLLMLFSLMFSQAIESVTRAYYARSDLDLILSSPAPSEHLFQVRTLVLTVQTIFLSVLIASPAINAMIYLQGASWLSAYVVLIAFGAVAAACAVWLTLFLFKVVGPGRTRLIAQIIAAVVGAGFVIALQAVAILWGEGFSRFSIFTSASTLTAAPDAASLWWTSAKAVTGEIWPLIAVGCSSVLFYAVTLRISAARFAKDVLSTAGLVEKEKTQRAFSGFAGKTSLRGQLRRKEWKLLTRDPWLVSQSLQQILYLVPPALMLWINYGEGNGIYYVIIPVVVMAAGQLSGGLAWLTISGEDAHDLLQTAPVSARTILIAKVEAVFVAIALLLSPFVIALALGSPRMALCLLGGAFMACASAVAIQLMFRSQANRSLFRRRQVSSKTATICEAFVSIIWAGAAAGTAYLGPVVLIPVFVLYAIVMGFAWMIRPRAV